VSLERGLVAHLKAAPAVAALVGERIYHERLPQKPTYPAITYARTSTDRYMTLQGPANISQVRIGLDCWASTAAELDALSTAVRAAVAGVTGTLGPTSIQHCTYETEADLSEFDGDRADRRVSFELVIWLNE
jgi:hypothetical protein